MRIASETVKTHTLTISDAELHLLWHRLNLSNSKFEAAYEPDSDVPYPEDTGSMCYTMWDQLDRLVKGVI